MYMILVIVLIVICFTSVLSCATPPSGSLSSLYTLPLKNDFSMYYDFVTIMKKLIFIGRICSSQIAPISQFFNFDEICFARIRDRGKLFFRFVTFLFLLILSFIFNFQSYFSNYANKDMYK